MDDFVDINIRQKDTFLENAEQDKQSLLLGINSGHEDLFFEHGLLWSRIQAEFRLLETLIGIPEIVELPILDYDSKGSEIFDLTDIFEEFDQFDHKTVADFSMLVLNKYSSMEDALKSILPHLESFGIAEKHMNYLWSLQTEEDISFLTMAASFHSYMYQSVYSLKDTMLCLCNICESPCYIYCAKKKQYVSEQSRVIVCLHGVMYSLDLLKALHCHRMKRLSIFLTLENIYPTVEWIEVENKFLHHYEFSSGGDFTYEMYMKGMADVYRELNSTFLNFLKGFFPGNEDLQKGADEILEWLEKSEFYYRSDGKLFEGIITQHIWFTRSLAAASAFYARLNLYRFVKDMSMVVQSGLNLLVGREAYKVDECKLMFAAEAKHLHSRYSALAIFGRDDATTPPRSE